MKKSQWQQFFDVEAEVYLQECFTQNTEQEVAFLVDLLALPDGAAVLDLGCGVGRHSLPLARHGWRMTGVDLSEGMLAAGRRQAAELGLDVEWVQHDAAEFVRPAAFDAAICLCEGALCLLGPDDNPLERDMRILGNICASLKPGARFVTTVLNGARMLRQFTDADVAAGRFDPLTMVEKGTISVQGSQGQVTVTTYERGYVPTEFVRMLRDAGFTVEALWGGTAGDWGKRPVKLDEMEIMAVARKPVQPDNAQNSNQ